MPVARVLYWFCAASAAALNEQLRGTRAQVTEGAWVSVISEGWVFAGNNLASDQVRKDPGGVRLVWKHTRLKICNDYYSQEFSMLLTHYLDAEIIRFTRDI